MQGKWLPVRVPIAARLRKAKMVISTISSSVGDFKICGPYQTSESLWSWRSSFRVPFLHQVLVKDIQSPVGGVLWVCSGLHTRWILPAVRCFTHLSHAAGHYRRTEWDKRLSLQRTRGCPLCVWLLKLIGQKYVHEKVSLRYDPCFFFFKFSFSPRSVKHLGANSKTTSPFYLNIFCLRAWITLVCCSRYCFSLQWLCRFDKTLMSTLEAPLFPA